MKLLIVDDHPMTCAGLQSLLQACYPEADISTRHDTTGLETAVAATDYTFLDMHLPDNNFVEILNRLAGQLQKVILISASPERAAVVLARARGVLGLLPKDANIRSVVEGFRRIQNGERVFDGLDLLVAAGLTSRQEDVLDALLRGLSNKQIARELGISDNTVKEYVTTILNTFCCSTRLELIVRHQNKGVF